MKRRLCFLLVLGVCVLVLAPLAAFAVALSEHRTASGPFDVAWFEAGDDGVPLVFVHGWTCDHTSWQHQTEFFAKERRVLALDLPGHGASSAPDASYSVDIFAAAVADVMTAAGIDRAVLVGHSLGGAICRRFAERFPERTAAVIIVDGAFVFPPEDKEARRAMQTDYAGIASAFGGVSHDENVRAFMSGMFLPETSEETRKAVLSVSAGTSPLVARRAMEDFTNLDNWVGLPAVTAPALAVYADASVALEPEIEGNLRTLFSDLRYEVVEKSDHFFMMEKPDEVNARIDAFLKDLR